MRTKPHSGRVHSRPGGVRSYLAALMSPTNEGGTVPRRPHASTGAFHWHMPLDPACPDNPMEAFYNDPMTIAYGMGDEMGPDIEARHLVKCKRCQEFGAANIEVEGP